ncbi:MAG: hypothetical protein HQL61_01115 [Magnetococcales bacterium]|nr:hypothetical protein [Nitrospirota bacterium]
MPADKDKSNGRTATRVKEQQVSIKEVNPKYDRWSVVKKIKTVRDQMMLSHGIISKPKILRGVVGRGFFILYVVVLFTLSGCAQQFKTPMFQPFDSKGWGPNGMAYNGRDLLIGDRDMVIALNTIRTGTYSSIHDLFTSDGKAMLSRFTVPLPRLFTICGMAWEGECCENGFLWIADSQNKELVKLNFNDNQVVKTFKMDGKETPNSLTFGGQPLKIQAPHGLTFDGQHLWLADAREGKIYQISTEDGRVLSAFKSPVKSPSGLAWDCDGIWVIGYDTCRLVTEDCQRPKLVKLDAKSGKVTHAIDLPNAVTRPSALQWMKDKLWIADYVLNRVFIAYDPYEVDDDTAYAIKEPQPPVKPEVMQPIEELPPLEFHQNPAAVQPPPVVVVPHEPPANPPPLPEKKIEKPKPKQHKQQKELDLPDK